MERLSRPSGGPPGRRARATYGVALLGAVALAQLAGCGPLAPSPTTATSAAPAPPSSSASPAVISFAPARDWSVPAGWKSETIPFPLPFAPQLAHRGVEELRFAPGMFDPAAPGYWSYAFVWWLEDRGPQDGAALGAELTAYFQGLLRDVAASRAAKRPVGTTATDLDLHAIRCTLRSADAREGWQRWTGEAAVLDAFGDGRAVKLRLLVEQRDVPGAGRRAVLVQASPASATAPVWASLEAVAAELRRCVAGVACGTPAPGQAGSTSTGPAGSTPTPTPPAGSAAAPTPAGPAGSTPAGPAGSPATPTPPAGPAGSPAAPTPPTAPVGTTPPKASPPPPPPIEGPPRGQRVRGTVLVWQDAKLFTEPKPDAPAIVVGDLRGGERAQRVGWVLPMKVIADRGGFVEVSPGSYDCARARLAVPPELDRLRLFVRRADIAPVLRAPVTASFPNGTSLALAAGSPVLPRGGELVAISVAGITLTQPLPKAKVTYSYWQANAGTPPRRRTAAYEVTAGTRVGLGTTWASLLPEDALRVWEVDRGDAAALVRYSEPCSEVTLVAPSDRVVRASPLRTAMGGSTIAFGGLLDGQMEEHYIRRGTSLTTERGRAVAVAKQDIRVERPTGELACFDAALALEVPRHVEPPTEVTTASLRLCAPAKRLKHVEPGP